MVLSSLMQTEQTKKATKSRDFMASTNVFPERVREQRRQAAYAAGVMVLTRLVKREILREAFFL